MIAAIGQNSQRGYKNQVREIDSLVSRAPSLVVCDSLIHIHSVGGKHEQPGGRIPKDASI